MNQSQFNFTVLILAAGRSERMGTPKPLLHWNGTTFLNHMLSNPIFKNDRVQPLVVLGHHAKEMETLLFPDVRFVTNTQYDSGRTSSVQCGLRFIPHTSNAFLVWPVDCPLVSETVFQQLLDHFQNPTNIMIPSYKMKRGHPPVIGIDYQDEILQFGPDQSLRDLYKNHQDKIKHVVVDDSAVLHNINTPEAYQNLLEQQ